MKAFIKKYKVYTSLLLLVVLLNGMLIYSFVQNQSPSLPIPGENEELEEEEVEEPSVPTKDTEIDLFVGNFTNDMQVKLNWKIDEGKQEVEKIALYQGTTLLANVTNQTSYMLPLMAYHFPTGPNEFTIKVTLDNKEVIEKTININIDYVFNVQTSYEIVGRGVEISVSYQYGEQTPLLPPTIYLANVSQAYFTVSAIETVQLENEPYSKEKTTYYMDLSAMSDGIYNFSLTWEFSNVNKKINLPMSVVIGDEIIVK